MKIKICIANFGESQMWCLDQMLREFDSFKKYEPHITIYTTVPVDRNHVLFDESVGLRLPFMTRQEIADSLNDYDLFLYNENDHLITEDNIDALLEHNQQLNSPFCSGFYRYEIRDDLKILVDWRDGIGPLIKDVYDENFSMDIVHQGCYLLTKDQLKFCIDSGEFLVAPRTYPYGMLEQGASDPYNRCGLTKVYPKNKELLYRLGIQHLSSKYSVTELYKETGITIDQILEYVK